MDSGFPECSARAVLSSRAIAPPRITDVMRQEVLAVILALLVVGSLGVGYFAGSQANPRTTMTTTLNSNGVCGNASASSGGLAVMLMPRNAIGFVCLSVDADSAQQAESGQALYSAGSLYSINNASNPSPAKGVNITLWSDFATPSNVTIEYLIRTSGNSTGAYTWWVGGKCPGFALVVAMNLTSAQPSLNSYYESGLFWSCPATSYVAQLDGLSGVSLQYL